VHITVDKELCAGHAMCNLAAPEVYPLGEDGFVLAEIGEIPAEQERAARIGMTACPERAISIDPA
jgi:ferredoxin